MAKDLRGEIFFQGREYHQFISVGVFCRGIFGILKIAVGPAPGIIEQRFIHPFKIKGQRDGFPYPSVAEYRTLNIKCQPAGILRGFVFLFIFDDVVIREIFPGITRRPVFGIIFKTQIKRTGLKRFKGDVIIQIVVLADGIKVPASTIDWQISGPIIFDARIDNILAHLPFRNAIRAAGERRR